MERKKGKGPSSGPGKMPAEALSCQTVGASVIVPSVVGEDGGSLTVKKHYLLVYMASPLGQKRLSSGDRSSDLKVRPTLESLATRF